MVIVAKVPHSKSAFTLAALLIGPLTSVLRWKPIYSIRCKASKDRVIGMTEQRMHNKNYTVTSHYLTLPIAAKVNVINGLYLECGPQFGFLLSKKDRLEGVEIDNSFNSNNTKKFDFGILGGLGDKFENGLFLDARYIRGFTGTSKVFDGGKNRVIQLSLGYLF